MRCWAPCFGTKLKYCDIYFRVMPYLRNGDGFGHHRLVKVKTDR